MPSMQDINTVRQWLKEIMTPEDIDWETYTRLRAVCRILDKLEYCHKLLDETGAAMPALSVRLYGICPHDRVRILAAKFRALQELTKIDHSRYKKPADTNNALFDFTPKFCPICGHEFELDKPLGASTDYSPEIDYHSGIKFECPWCRLSFYYVRDLYQVTRRHLDEEKVRNQK